jgi:hypothetical protein
VTPPSTSSLPLFEQSCKEVLARLEGDASYSADGMRIEARDLLAVIESWKTDLPAAEARSATVSKVMDLYSRTLDYLANKS